VGIGQSGEGGQRLWYEFNASVLIQEGHDGMKRCRKMKRRQRTRLDSIERKRATA
jgi:hypothetical protein